MRSVLARLGRRTRAGEPTTIDIDDPALRVVVEAFDETEAASAALARAARWQPERPAVLRHHLILPATAVEDAEDLLHEDGWTVRASHRDHARAETPNTSGDESTVIALRVQRLDALHCAQESARMAGLAQRFRGRALGWDAMQPETPD
nr:hypothetical protein [Halopolyspora algeriensis]